jgi:hypothetical protein
MLSSFALECFQYESQIIASGEVFLTHENGSCSARVTFVKSYKPSIVCPVDLSDIVNSFIFLIPSQCEQIKRDSVIAGIIIQDPDERLILEN